MNKKIIVGYCPECGQLTKHEVIQCEERLGWRIFESIVSMGLIPALDGYRYDCECLKCGEINKLRK